MSNLIFIGDIRPYKEQIKGLRKKQYRRLLEQADRYEAYQLPVHHPKESTTYMGVAIMNLALAYCLSGEEKYLFEAKRFIGTVLSYEQWGNAHLVNVDLSASWILFGLSLGYDWLKLFLGEEEKEQILAKIRHHADIMYQYKLDTTGHGWSTNYYQNHNWINMTGLAAAGYVLSDTYDKAIQYTEEAKKNFGKVFSLLADDGSNYEGVPYWRYGGMWLFVYAHLLKVQENIDYFKTSNYLKHTFYYRLYQSCGDFEQQMNFGDSHDRHSGHAPCVYYKVAAEYGDGFAQTFANLVLDEFLMVEAQKSKIKPGILPEAAFEFLWYEPKVSEKPLSLLPKVRYFEDLGLLSMRENWSRSSKVLTMKCGYPGGRKQWMNGWDLYRREGLDCLSLSHHHPDNLSYIFTRGSEYLTCEDGYNRNIMPDNHNVILVDNQYSDVENVNDIYMSSAGKRLEKDPFYPIEDRYRGEVVYLEIDDSMVIYKGETSGIYPEEFGMKEVSRLLFTDELFFFLFVDVCVSDRNHIYRIISNTDMPAQKQNDHTYYYPMETGGITYTVFSDQEICSKQYSQEIVSVMTSQEPDKLCSSYINTLSFQSVAPTKKQTLIECFTFDGTNTEVTFEGANLHVRHGDKEYQLIFGDEMTVSIIKVCSKGGERKSYRVP
ncbi:DUF4962 domain-containing protein [Lacrimispora defluvii]|uniref:DUF4962 domain-containing protein n=1 Tax=Lacrimispora defluvii TaxID=2719233 RepID=A0ABX1VVY7_9FIRM|nr:DUF4962 domain-containing protein [Lacrimispora defluvii]NNJ30992.1 DUF4962 domain-containing protein [Lacrimispora defluvii]